MTGGAGGEDGSEGGEGSGVGVGRGVVLTGEGVTGGVETVV